MKLGIHNNYKCKRCGACCVYFPIRDERFAESIGFPQLFKRGREACENLHYDDRRRKYSCKIYSNGRPVACQKFFCNAEWMTSKDIRLLKQTAKEMPEIVR